MKKINWKEVKDAQEYEKLLPGGYICQITAVKDEPEKEYLKIEYDIADGKMKGHFKELYDNAGFWGGNFIKSYKEKAQPFFKAFLTAVGKSNSGFQFNDDENTLRGKFVGLVLGEEEYQANDGSVKTRLYVDEIRSIDRIKSGDYKVPQLKRLDIKNNAEPQTDDFVPLDDIDELPF